MKPHTRTNKRPWLIAVPALLAAHVSFGAYPVEVVGSIPELETQELMTALQEEKILIDEELAEKVNGFVAAIEAIQDILGGDGLNPEAVISAAQEVDDEKIQELAQEASSIMESLSEGPVEAITAIDEILSRESEGEVSAEDLNTEEYSAYEWINAKYEAVNTVHEKADEVRADLVDVSQQYTDRMKSQTQTVPTLKAMGGQLGTISQLIANESQSAQSHRELEGDFIVRQNQELALEQARRELEVKRHQERLAAERAAYDEIVAGRTSFDDQVQAFTQQESQPISTRVAIKH